MQGQTSPLLQAFPELPGNVTSLLAKARESGTPVIHIREMDCTTKSKWLPWWDELHPPGGVGVGRLCAPEPWAADKPGEHVFVKHAYDAFQSGTVSEELLLHLRDQGIHRLYFAGALTKACVMFSANSAFTLGFEVCIVGDCCADRSRAHHDAVLKVYDGYHIRVLRLAELIFGKTMG